MRLHLGLSGRQSGRELKPVYACHRVAQPGLEISVGPLWAILRGQRKGMTPLGYDVHLYRGGVHEADSSCAGWIARLFRIPVRDHHSFLQRPHL